MALQYANETLRGDVEVVKEAIGNNEIAYAYERNILWFANKSLFNNVNFLLALRDDIVGLNYVWENCQRRDDPEFMSQLLAKFPKLSLLRHAHEILRGNREVILTAVSQNGMNMQFAHETMKRDREVILAAVTQNGMAVYFAHKTMKSDREVILAAVTQNGMAVQFAHETMKSDREVILAAVTQNGMAIKYASKIFKTDRIVILAALSKYARALGWADKTLSGDKQFALEAAAQNVEALRFADISLRCDREFCLAAVTQNASAIKFVHKDLCSDKEIGLEAVHRNGDMLKYLGKTLRADEDVIVAAIAQNEKSSSHAAAWITKKLRIEAAILHCKLQELCVGKLKPIIVQVCLTTDGYFTCIGLDGSELCVIDDRASCRDDQQIRFLVASSLQIPVESLQIIMQS